MIGLLMINLGLKHQELWEHMTKKPEDSSSIHLLLVCWHLDLPAVSSIVGTMFTHHQKCVLVDTQANGNNRKITAFIGGIDLCDGRYDTPEHRLFHDLDTVFEDDFHNPTFSAALA
uniref:phospholipase D n=1 Tax=Salix viminalis TaxID=40686 RepID=A0A6N2N7G2_SALVM